MTHNVEIKPAGTNPLGRRFQPVCRTCGTPRMPHTLTPGPVGLGDAIDAKAAHLAGVGGV